MKSYTVVDGDLYYLVSIEKFKNPAPYGNTCFNCIAHRNMKLCDKLCSECKLGFIFREKTYDATDVYSRMVI